MSFHRLSKGDDRHGIVPSVFTLNKHGKHDRRTFAKSAHEIGAQPRAIRLEQATLQQGPLRHPDFVEWSGDGSPFGYFLVVSPRVHELLSVASLPAHTVHEAVVHWPKKALEQHGRGPSTYLVYAFDQAGMLDALDLETTSLSCTVRRLSERMNAHTELPAGTVGSGAEAWLRSSEVCPEGQRAWVTPTALLCPVNEDFRPVIDFESPHFPIATRDFDLLFLDHSHDALVSDELRAALEAMGATGIQFAESWDDAKLRAPTSPERTARGEAMLTFAQANAGEPATDPLFTQRLARRKEVLARRDRLQTKRGGPSEDALGALEERLDVELPAEYRDAISIGELPNQSRFLFYKKDELKTLDDIDPDWTEKSAPQAVRALIVAVDEYGDYLGYMLRADSMTQLDDRLTHFHHETGAVTRSRFRFKLKEPADAEE